MPRPFDYKTPRKTSSPTPKSRAKRLMQRPQNSKKRVLSRKYSRIPSRTIWGPLATVLITVCAVLLISWWGFLSLVPLILPVSRDIHLVLELPISTQRINTYLFALSTIDHRVKVVELPSLLPMSSASDAATLQTWSLQAQGLGAVPKRAALSRAIGLPIDTVVSVPMNRPLSMTWPSTISSADDVKKVWWNLAQLPRSVTDISRRERWSWWSFMAGTRGEGLEIMHPIDVAEFERLRPRLSRASVFTQCTVAVVNTTGVRGLATELSQILENAEIKVIRVADTATTDQVGRIVVDPNAPECQAQAALVSVLSSSTIQIETGDQLPKLYRAKIVWMIGNESVLK